MPFLELFPSGGSKILNQRVRLQKHTQIYLLSLESSLAACLFDQLVTAFDLYSDFLILSVININKLSVNDMKTCMPANDDLPD